MLKAKEGHYFCGEISVARGLGETGGTPVLRPYQTETAPPKGQRTDYSSPFMVSVDFLYNLMGMKMMMTDD